MSGRLTLWGSGQILRSFFGKTTEPPPNFYLAVVKEIFPSPYMSGSELDEPDIEAGYQRVAIPNDALSWNAEDGMLHVVSNSIEVSFIPALLDWGRVGFWALCNADIEGYVYMSGALDEEQLILAGDQMVMGADELTVELGPFFTEEDF